MTNANWHDTQTGRLALKWAPSDDLTVTPSIYAQTLHYNDTGAYWVSLSNPSGQPLLQRQRAARSEHRPLVSGLRSRWIGTRRSRTWCRTPRTSRAISIRSRTTRSGSTRCSSATSSRGPAAIPEPERDRILHRQPEQFHAGVSRQLRRSARAAHLDRRALLFARAREHHRIHLRSELCRQCDDSGCSHRTAAGRLYLPAAGLQHARQAVRGVRRGEFQVHRSPGISPPACAIRTSITPTSPRKPGI